MKEPVRIEYWLNKLDEVVYVNEAWTQFALENDGVGLGPENILHRPLYGFITDSTMRLLYWDMLKRVRAGYTLQFPFRCDSPTQYRLLEMTVTPDVDGLVKFSTLEVLVKERTPIRLFASSARRSTALVRVCSWCKRIEVESQQWVEVEDAIFCLRLFERDRLPRLSHGICQDCLTMLRKNWLDKNTETL